jgi:hypothetical protein
MPDKEKPIKFSPEVEARFQRIERNLEQVTRTMNTTAAINAETAQLAKANEKAIKRLISLVDGFVRGRSNGKGK